MGRRAPQQFLCSFHRLQGLFSGFSDLFSVQFYCRNFARALSLMRSGYEAHPELVWGLFRCCRGPSIYGVLYYWQPVRPVVLLIVAVDPECGFDVLIGFLRLSIRLWVIGSAEVLRDLQLLAQLLEECRGETWVPI